MRQFRLACLTALAVLWPVLQAEAGGCTTRAEKPWPAGGQGYTVSAFTDGPDCERAVAVIVVRDAAGAPLWIDSFNAQHVAVLAGIADAGALEAGLAEWITYDGMPSTAALPAWAEGADSPMLAEFPFLPEPGFDRASWEEQRAADRPVFCYVQGMESMACVMLGDGFMEKLGVQLFPG